MKLYADGEHPERSVLAAQLEVARPFQIRKATVPMVLETGQSLTRTPNKLFHISYAIRRHFGL